MSIYQTQKNWDEFNQKMCELFDVEYFEIEYESIVFDNAQRAPSPNKGNKQEPTRLGIKHTAESKKKISERMNGKKHPMYGLRHTDEMKKIISEKTKNGMPKGYKLSQETRQKMSAYHLNAPKMICKHCGKEGNLPAMFRWHNDNCKMKD